MERSKRILMISHCILNQNTVVEPLARDQKNLLGRLMPYLEKGVGIVQLPCPEVRCMGLRRWGHVKEQFDHPLFRSECRSMTSRIVDDISEYLKNGYEIVGVAGIEGSPSCGCVKTCSSKEWRGSVGRSELKDTVEVIESMGVFMEELRSVLVGRGIEINFFDLIKMGD